MDEWIDEPGPLPPAHRLTMKRLPSSRRSLLALAGLLLGAAPSAQYIVNGSMDGTPAFSVVPPGWNQSIAFAGSDILAPTSTWLGHTWQPSSDGGTFVHSYGCSPLLCISEDVKQTITGLVPGQTYTVEFEQTAASSDHVLWGELDDAGWWRVTFGAQTIDSALMVPPPHGQPSVWVPQALQFTATAISQELKFEAVTADHTAPVISTLGLDGVALACADNNAPPWLNLAHGLAGTYGEPCLVGMGPLTANDPLTLTVSNAKELENAFLVIGFSAPYLPFLGGTLVPEIPPLGIVQFFMTDANGQYVLPATWPAGIPSGTTIYAQAWIHDGAAVQGFSASNAVSGTAP